MSVTANTMVIRTIAIDQEIHMGESTHHQDHVILPVNFSATNRTAKREAKLGPRKTVVGTFDIIGSFLTHIHYIRIVYMLSIPLHVQLALDNQGMLPL